MCAADTHTGFLSTSSQGLRQAIPPMRLWHKAKKLGIWDPQSIDLSQDELDWARLTGPQQDVILRLTALFQAGEESVTLDLLPLMMVIAQEGRLEEEMYLTSFLWEEAKHVEAFRRFLDEVAHDRSDLSRFHTPNYRTIFYEQLPRAMYRLRADSSPEAQAIASVTYNMIVEGVLAETGYHAYFSMLERNAILPGMQSIIAHLKQDESRHLAYGVYLLSRLVAESGESVWSAIEARMAEMIVPAIGVIDDLFSQYEGDVPFGLQVDEFVAYAMSQFQKRMDRIERARTQTLEQVNQVAVEEELAEQ